MFTVRLQPKKKERTNEESRHKRTNYSLRIAQKSILFFKPHTYWSECPIYKCTMIPLANAIPFFFFLLFVYWTSEVINMGMTNQNAVFASAIGVSEMETQFCLPYKKCEANKLWGVCWCWTKKKINRMKRVMSWVLKSGLNGEGRFHCRLVRKRKKKEKK